MRRRSLRRPLAVLGVLALAGGLVGVAAPPASAVGACTRTWDGGAGTTTWADAANWTGDAVPGATDVACIDNGSLVVATTVFNVKGLSITNGTLSMQSSGTVGADGLLVDAVSTSQFGRLEASTSGPGGLTVNGDLTVSGGDLFRTDTSTLGQILQNPGFQLVLTSKAGRAAKLGQTVLTAKSINAQLSGSAVLDQFSLDVDKVTVAAGTDFSSTIASTVKSGAIDAQGDAGLDAALTLTGGSSSVSGNLSVRGLVGQLSFVTLTIADGKKLTTTGAGSWEGNMLGTGTFRKQGSGTFFLTRKIDVGKVEVAGGELRVKSGASFTAGRVEVAGVAGPASLIADPNQTMSVGTGGVLLDDGNPSATDGAGQFGGGIISVSGPIDIAEGTIVGTTLTQTGAANNITATPFKGVAGPQYLFLNSTITTAGDVDITGAHQVAQTGVTSRRLVLEPGTTVSDPSATRSSSYVTQGVVTSPGTTPSLTVNDGLGLTVNGSVGDLAGGLAVTGKAQVTGSSANLAVPAGATLSVTGGLSVSTGTLSGAGTVDASVSNSGTVAPGGASVGTLKVTKYTQTTSGRLDIQLASDSASDVLDVTGPDAPSLAGVARIFCVGGYLPSGVSFDVVTAVAAPANALAPSGFCSGVNGTTSVVGKAVRLTFPAATTAPGAPGVSLTPTVGGLDVVVTPPTSNGGSDIIGYSITCTPACTGGSLTGAAGGTFPLTGLTGGQTYTVSVTATNAIGTGAPTTADGVPLSPAATAPAAPGVAVTAKVQALDVTITAPANGGSPITGYTISCVPACASVVGPVQAGTTTLTGLTGGTAYAVSVAAVNAVGTSTPTTVTRTALAPAPTSTAPATAIVGSTSGSFTVTCSHNRGRVKACGAVLRGANGTVYGQAVTVTVAAGAPTITLTVRVNAAGIAASKKLGGLNGIVSITTTSMVDAAAVTTKAIRVTQRTTVQTWTSSSFFTTSGTTLTPAGKTTLTAVARAVAGSKTFRCEVNVAKTSSAANDYNRGLTRASAICAFIKATIKAKGWKPIGTYSLKSWGSTKPIALSKAWVKLSAGN